MKHNILLVGLLTLGCDQTLPSGDEDAGTDAPPQNPLDEIDPTTVVPADGTNIGPDDDPLHVSFEVPEIAPGYTGTVPTVVDATVTMTGDATTPGDPSDDWNAEVFTNTEVPLGSLTAGSIGLDTVNDGLGVQGGESLQLEMVVSCVRPTGTFTREATVSLTYLASP